MIKEIKKLNRNYLKAIQNYIDYFEKKQGYDVEYIDTTGWVDVGNFTLSIDSIILDVDYEIEKGVIFDYADYCFVNAIEKRHFVNYASYIKGMR